MKLLVGKILSTLAVFLLFTHVLSERIILTAFELNSNYIQSELCVQKDALDNSCFGKCYLSNKMEQNQERKEKPEFQTQKEFFYLPTDNTSEAKDFPIIRKKYLTRNENLSIKFSISVFHPPSLLV